MKIVLFSFEINLFQISPHRDNGRVYYLKLIKLPTVLIHSFQANATSMFYLTASLAFFGGTNDVEICTRDFARSFAFVNLEAFWMTHFKQSFGLWMVLV